MTFLKPLATLFLLAVTWQVHAASVDYQHAFAQAQKAANEERYEQAATAWKTLLTHYPNDLAVMNNLAVTLMKQGDYLKAQSVLEEALNSDAKIAMILKNLNAIYGYQSKLAYQNVFQEDKVATPNGEWFSLKAVTVDQQDVKKAKKVSNDIQQVLNRVENWRHAWSAQNLKQYLSFYEEGFQPDEKTANASWKASRKRSLTRPKFIDVKLDEVEAVLLDKGLVQVSFWQSYRSNTFKDRVKKLVVLKKHGNTWLISIEKVIHG